MPTRLSSKPSSYTFNAGTRHGANMQAGWIFLDSDISGNNITDVTGNGNTIVKVAGAATETTDSTHGKCFRGDGGSGATFDPPAGWDSFTDYSFIVGLKVENNTSANEYIMSLIDTAGAQDAFSMQWLSNENVFVRLEDQDSSYDLTVTDGLLNDAGKWVTLAVVCDATSDEVRLYIIKDTEATILASAGTAGISGTPDTSDQFSIVGNFHGLMEYCFVLDAALSTAEVEAFHVDPYAELGSSVFTISGTTPTTPVSGQSVVVNLSGATNATGKTLTYNGETITVDSQDISTMTINSWPQLPTLGSPAVSNYQTSYVLEVTDGLDTAQVNKSTDPNPSYDLHAITGLPYPVSSIYYDDIGVADGMTHYGHVSNGGSIDSIAANGVITGYTEGTDYTYWIYDNVLVPAQWSTSATETLTFGTDELPVITANLTAIAPDSPELPIITANLTALAPVESELPIIGVNVTALLPVETPPYLWGVPSSNRILEIA